MRPTEKEKYEVLGRLGTLGIDPVTGQKLRRIAMTLRNWFELECGIESKIHPGCTLSIERDDATEEPRMYLRGRMRGSKEYTTTSWHCKDQEKGARRRLDKMMDGMYDLLAYVQTDPRGCSLYILRRKDVVEGENINAVYTRGVAVH